MVQLMLEGLGGNFRKSTAENPRRGWQVRMEQLDENLPPDAAVTEVQCFHVNSRFSADLELIGRFTFRKGLWLLYYILQAIWCRFRYRAKVLYYVPAPGKGTALYRDWLVMLFCRGFFKRLVLHWHAAGLGHWLQQQKFPLTRPISLAALGRSDLSIVLSDFNRRDIGIFEPKSIAVVYNGIPDPCQDFAQRILQRRIDRLAFRKKLIEEVQEEGGESSMASACHWAEVLFLAHCTEEKGLFDAMSGVLLANQSLAEKKSPLRFRLNIAGNFFSENEKTRFKTMVREHPRELCYVGFVKEKAKQDLLESADLFCFPSYFSNENQPVNLIEAMAFGLPILTTRWRSIPELFRPDYLGLVEPRDPQAVANCLIVLATCESGVSFRETYKKFFTLDSHLNRLAFQLQEVAFPPLRRSRQKPAPRPAYHTRRPLRIIQVFNDYLNPGGEANSVARIASDLECAGHEVHRFWRTSHEWTSVEAPPIWKQPFLMWRNPAALQELALLQKNTQADLWLLHNVLPVISLGVYDLATSLDVPILQWLHNYRPISPSGTLFAGATALKPDDRWIYLKESVAGSWNGRIRTALLCYFYSLMKRRNAFASVKAWVGVSDEVKQVFKAARWEVHKLEVIRHSWHFTRRSFREKDQGYFLFLGRMVEVKGVRFLMDLWQDPAFARVRLLMAGTGSLTSELAVNSQPQVEWVGQVDGEAKTELLAGCRAVLLPVLWSEPLSTVAYEAYEHHKPMLTSELGGMKEVVFDQETGRLLPPGDRLAWREALLELCKNPELAQKWGRQGNQWLQTQATLDKWNETFDKIAAKVLKENPRIG